MKNVFLLLILSIFVASCTKEEGVDSWQTTKNGYNLYALKSLEPTITKGAALNRKLWENGQTIKIVFLNGTVAQKNLVKQFAEEWTQYANIAFDFEPTGDADVKIAFRFGGDKVTWSYVGTDAKNVAQNQPTINFGDFVSNNVSTKRNVLMMFGHMLGLVNEHKSLGSEIPWDVDVVYEYYCEYEGWTEEEVNAFFFQPYSNAISNYTEYDPQSIMIWPVEDFLTTDGAGIFGNNELSEIDKKFITELYPKRNKYKIMAYASRGFSEGEQNEYAKLIERVQLEKPDIFVCFGSNRDKVKSMADSIGMDYYYKILDDDTYAPGRIPIANSIFLRKSDTIKTYKSFLNRANSSINIASTYIYLFEFPNYYLCTSGTPSQDENALINADLVNKKIEEFTNGSAKPKILVSYAGPWHSPNVSSHNNKVTIPELYDKFDNWNIINKFTHYSGNLQYPYAWWNYFVSVNKSVNSTVLRQDQYNLKAQGSEEAPILIVEVEM